MLWPKSSLKWIDRYLYRDILPTPNVLAEFLSLDPLHSIFWSPLSFFLCALVLTYNIHCSSGAPIYRLAIIPRNPVWSIHFIFESEPVSSKRCVQVKHAYPLLCYHGSDSVSIKINGKIPNLFTRSRVRVQVS